MNPRHLRADMALIITALLFGLTFPIMKMCNGMIDALPFLTFSFSQMNIGDVLVLLSTFFSRAILLSATTPHR